MVLDRRVVIAVTATALAAAVLLSSLLLRPTYEASALVTIAGPVPAVGDIVPLVHNEHVAAQVAKRLPSGQVPRPALLVRSVRMTVVGERMVRITARDVSPAGAAALAGAWAGAVAEHVEALVSREFRQSLVALNELNAPRTTTVFSLIGVSPAPSAPAIPASTRSRRPPRVMRPNLAGSRVSRLMFTRRSPAPASGPVRESRGGRWWSWPPLRCPGWR